MPDFLSLPFEEDMNQAEIQAMIDASIKSNFNYHFPFDVVPYIGRNSPGSSFTRTLEGPAVVINQAAPGANKVFEITPLKVVSDEFFELRAGNQESFRRRWGCFVGHYLVGAGPSATQYAGIEFGSYDTSAPFTNPVAAVAQLRFRASDSKFEFATGKGDGTAPVVDVIDLGTVLPHGTYMEIEDDPVSGVIKAYIDNVLVASRSSSSPAYPDFGAYPVAASGISWPVAMFCTSGSDANGSWDQGLFFSNANYTIYWR